MHLFTADELAVMLLSIRVVTVGVLIGLPFAVGFAWILARSNWRGKWILDMVISLPLVMPPVVTGYALLIVLGRGSLAGAFLGKLGIDFVFTWGAAALAAGLVALPLMARTIEVAFASVDVKLEKTARTLGASPSRVFRTITIPLAAKGILAGTALGFARGLGEFGATIVVAGNIPGRTQTLPLAIFTQLQTGDDLGAIRLIALSFILALVALIIHRSLSVRRHV